MQRTLWIAASGMTTQQQLTDVIANNMANVNTTGFKRSSAHFQDMLYQTISTPGAATTEAETPVGIQYGTGAKTVAVSPDFEQGDFKETDSQLDMALEGQGFFKILLPDGTETYTRNGNFHLNSQGQVVTSQGYQVEGFPSIETNASEITIASDGTVSTTVGGTTTTKGRITLTRFTNPEGLKALGYSLYEETEASGTPITGNPGESGYATIAQNYLETSNVNIVQEMVDLIAAQRAYELNSKAIKTSDNMLQMIANLK